MESKTAVMTGGAGDLAQAMVPLLEAQGWSVLAPGRDELDVTSSASVDAFFTQLASVDLLINNAGVTADRLFTNMTEVEYDRVVDVCLKGAFLCSQKVMWLMAKKRSGHIINVGSFSALFGTAGQSNYAAAKAGLMGLTKSLASEYGGKNVRSNCVLPGFLETKMTTGLLSDSTIRTAVLQMHRLKRLNTVEDAARFIVFLDSMKHVSGQVFQLDSRTSRW